MPLLYLFSPIISSSYYYSTTSSTSTTSTSTINTVQALISSYEIYREASGVYRWRYWNSVGEKIAESSLTYGSAQDCKQDILSVQKSEGSTIILGASGTGGVYSYMIYKDLFNYQLVFRWRFNDFSGREILHSFQLRKTDSDCYQDIKVLQHSGRAAVIIR